MTISRRAFMLSGAMVPGVARRSIFPSGPHAQPARNSEQPAVSDAPPKSSSAPSITPMLYGLPRSDTNLQSWFASMKRWGVREWMSFAIPDRPHYAFPAGHANRSVAFLADAWPGFKPYFDAKTLTAQESAIRRVANLSAASGIGFSYLIPFPLFPVQDQAVVEKAAPDFFKAGRLNLFYPGLADLLKAEIRAFKKALPALKGINLWMAEGAGAIGDITREDLEHNKEWERPLIQAFNEVTQELEIGGILFAHHYLQTVGTHRNVYEMMANFPQLILMDDITWPEEDMLHPFLGYLPQTDRELLFQTNPVALNFLLDTEYIGEGVLPSVYPRWWKYNVGEAARAGAKIAMGRTFFWDGGLTDVNFNRLNAYLFVRFCYNPDADARQMLEEAAREMFGAAIPERLVDILWETEPVVKKITGINGVDSLTHSRFPEPVYLDVLYTPRSNAMKAVDDLFSPAGTPLYPPLTDSLNNYKQWRWQNKTVSKPAAVYLGRKKEAISWIEAILPEVRRLSAPLASHHREMFVSGYEILAALAKGMELFVETAALHYQWAHAKTLDDGVARAKFRDCAARFRAIAAKAPENPFLYRQRMLAFAEFLESDLLRISPKHE